jgi:serine/threonine protein kinase
MTRTRSPPGKPGKPKRVKYDVDSVVNYLGFGQCDVEKVAKVLLDKEKTDRTSNISIHFYADWHGIQTKKYVFIYDNYEYSLPEIGVKDISDNADESCTYRLIPEQIIGGGSYGIVVKYTEPFTANFAWFIKIEYSDESMFDSHGRQKRVPEHTSEYDIVKTLNTKNINCGQIGAKNLTITPTLIKVKDLEEKGPEVFRFADFILLESMQGNLNSTTFQDIIRYRRVNIKEGRKKFQIIICIVEQARRQILCLLNKSKYAYTDLKPENILFRVAKDNRIIIKLGDLGSMATEEDGTYIATFPCLPDGIVPLTTTEEKEQCLAWQLGVLLADLLGFDTEILRYYNMVQKEHIIAVRRQIYYTTKYYIGIPPKEAKKYAKKYANLLNLDTSKRTKLSDNLVPKNIKCSDFLTS